jgi:3-hydroxyisobutyrate dehydrogenase
MTGRPQRIGWIGIGKMGAPMSLRVLRGGYPVTALDPSLADVGALVAEGAELAASAAELARASDLIFLTIPDDQALEDIVFGDDGLLAAADETKLIVEMSTISPAMSANVAEALAVTGARYLRAPVSGSTVTAADGKLTVLASGPTADYQIALPVFSCFSVRQFRVGEGEEARYLKLVLNLMLAGTAALVAEGLTFGEKGGLTVETMLDVISESVVGSPVIGYKRDMLVRRDFTPAFAVSQMMKDIDLALDSAKVDHVPMALTALVRQQYGAAHAQGHGARDFFMLLEQCERAAGLSV